MSRLVEQFGRAADARAHRSEAAFPEIFRIEEEQMLENGAKRCARNSRAEPTCASNATATTGSEVDRTDLRPLASGIARLHKDLGYWRRCNAGVANACG